jgi:hypothetical protein
MLKRIVRTYLLGDKLADLCMDLVDWSNYIDTAENLNKNKLFCIQQQLAGTQPFVYKNHS